MKSQTNLVRRGSVYYFRARIPQDLIAHYKKQEVIRSLRTKDKTEAIAKLRLERLMLDQEFAHVRREQAIRASNELTHAESVCLASLHEAMALPPNQNPRVGVSETDNRDSKVLAEQILSANVLKILNDSKSYNALFNQLLQAQKRLSWPTNNIGFSEDGRASVLTSRAEDTLNHLLKYWQSQGNKAPKTIQEAISIVKKFSRATKDKPASRITKSDVVGFKDALIAEGNMSATVSKKIDLLKAIFQTAVDNDKLPLNPASGVKVPKEDRGIKSRIPFSTSELHTIFSSSIYTQGERPRAGAGEAAYWIPLIALWTGARLEEIGQLHIADIQQELGIHFLHITNEGGGKRVKTASSRRRVPIHPELIRYGLLEYVETLKNAHQTRLF